MIERRGFGPFSRATLWYEPQESVDRYLAARNDARVHIYSFALLTLPADFRLFLTKETTVISLAERTESDVLGSFGDTVRNEIRQTMREPRLRFECEPFTGESYDLYRRFEVAQGRSPRPLSEFRKLVVFTARYDGRLICGISCMQTDPLLRVRSIFSARLDEKADADLRRAIGQGSKRLVYDACVWGIAHRYRGLDLAYVNRIEPEKAGITEFKLRFKGDIVPEYQYEKISFLVRLLRSLRA